MTLRISPQLWLDQKDLEWQFIRASGPGGQNVNKVASAVQLRFDLRAADYLPERLRERLQVLARKRINKDGVLIIDASRHRTQERNRDDALQKLIDLIRQAAVNPKPRLATQPSQASRRRRLEVKRLTGLKKNLRRSAADSE